MVPHHSAFTLLIVGSSSMKRWRYQLSVFLLVIVSSTCISDVQAQVPSHQNSSTEINVATVYRGHVNECVNGLGGGPLGLMVPVALHTPCPSHFPILERYTGDNQR